MPKGEQRSNKMAKKPKKDTSAPKDSTAVSTRPIAPTTTAAQGKAQDQIAGLHFHEDSARFCPAERRHAAWARSELMHRAPESTTATRGWP
jgi:hypothetical protein